MIKVIFLKSCVRCVYNIVFFYLARPCKTISESCSISCSTIPFKFVSNPRFLDSSQFNADDLERKYEELDEERVREIHSMLRYTSLSIVFTDIDHDSFVEQKLTSSTPSLQKAKSSSP